jgi:predicted AAA+ superfamily ATPase
MIERRLTSTLLARLDAMPAVGLLGPRQSGKTTLALSVGVPRDAIYLDLESESDRGKLAEPEAYLSAHLDRLVILDEIHRAPGLFPILRGLIDRSRRSGRKAGQYLLLGAASLDLLRQSGETLAGRIAYLELSPLDALEARSQPLDDLWLRGGFPESLLARDDADSLHWRQDFIRTYLERDIPQFGPRLPAETLRRLWAMLAHNQGGMLNSALLARNLGLDVKTINSYLDLLVDLLLVRRLPPWHANLGKRLVKAPRIFVRDSGLVHALVGVPDRETLLSHPILGPSWEGMVIENLIAAAPDQAEPFFFRTAGGAEIDLLLAWPGGNLWAIEVKRSLAPKLERGFHVACEDLNPVRRVAVYPGTERYPMGSGVEAMPLPAIMEELAALR